MKDEKAWREAVLRRLGRLADRRANDAVKLAFLEQPRLEDIDKMDLGGLTELKRHGNGAVEIKLVDRVAALEKLFEMTQRGGDGAGEFLQALERSAKDGDGEP